MKKTSRVLGFILTLIFSISFIEITLAQSDSVPVVIPTGVAVLKDLSWGDFNAQKLNLSYFHIRELPHQKITIKSNANEAELTLIGINEELYGGFFLISAKSLKGNSWPSFDITVIDSNGNDLKQAGGYFLCQDSKSNYLIVSLKSNGNGFNPKLVKRIIINGSNAKYTIDNPLNYPLIPFSISIPCLREGELSNIGINYNLATNSGTTINIKEIDVSDWGIFLDVTPKKDEEIEINGTLEYSNNFTAKQLRTHEEQYNLYQGITKSIFLGHICEMPLIGEKQGFMLEVSIKEISGKTQIVSKKKIYVDLKPLKKVFANSIVTRFGQWESHFSSPYIRYDLNGRTNVNPNPLLFNGNVYVHLDSFFETHGYIVRMEQLKLNNKVYHIVKGNETIDLYFDKRKVNLLKNNQPLFECDIVEFTGNCYINTKTIKALGYTVDWDETNNYLRVN